MIQLMDKNELKEWVDGWFVMNKYYHPYSTQTNIPVFELYDIVERIPTVDAVPVIRCKDCKYFELDYIDKEAMGIPLIMAHEICTRWGNGCKTSSDGYCFMAERKEE